MSVSAYENRVIHILAEPARLTAASTMSIVDALLGEVIVTLMAALSFAESERQAQIDSASSNVSACCVIDLRLIIPAQLRVGRQT